MQRRTFLLGSVGVVLSTAVVGTVAIQSQALKADVVALLDELAQLSGQPLRSSGQWTPSQIFQHLAQSVRGSVLGYPVTKPAWFTQTIGPMALQSFKACGRMYHSLTEPIPGMLGLDANMPVEVALADLIEALRQFLLAEQLAPHFAYGALSPSDYQAAHWLHIRQHLTEIQS